MAITLHTTPGSYFSVNGDLLWVVSDAAKAADSATYPNYKYIADIYIGGVSVARIKKVPLPVNYMGVFNLADIIRNYVSVTFSPTELQLVAQELGSEEFLIGVTVKFGEEYDGVIYPDLQADSERTFFGHYNGRVLGGLTILSSFLDKAASIRPYATGVQLSDRFTLIPYFPTSGDAVDVTFSKYGSPVTPSVTIEWGYTGTDPHSDPTAVTLQFSGLYASGLNSFSPNFTSSGSANYLVVKEPISEPVKTQWYNTAFNYGTFPDSVFRSYIESGGYRYYYSRIPVILDSLNYAIEFSNGLPNPSGPTVVTASFTETFTPTPVPLGAASFSYTLAEETTPEFIDGNAQVKIDTISKGVLNASGTIDFTTDAGGAYIIEAFGETAPTDPDAKMRLTVTKNGVVIFDEQVDAADDAYMSKAGIVQPSAAYVATISTYYSTDSVTPIDIADDEPVLYIYGMQVLNISPVLVNALFPGFLDSSVVYYTATIGSETLRLNLVCEPKYENYSIHFLNKLGGFETRDFDKVSRKTISINKSEFGRLPYEIDASGNVYYYNGNNVYNDTRAVFSSQFKDKLLLNTDILTDAEYTWLGELIVSPMVYVEMDGYMVPCVIVENNYEFRKQINDKLTNLTINIEFGDVFNTQFR